MVLPLPRRPQSSYRGRFAPSPSGLLHFGSLISALASYLHAKSCQGKWLVRIEDIDPPREQAGASSAILSTLEAFGLHWDEEVLYQSKQTQVYLDVLDYLKQQKLSYFCQCTRAEIKAAGGIYPGICKSREHAAANSAIRLINSAGHFQYQDIFQGAISCDPALAREDFILLRKDGLFAYQLAVVVDDICQGISHVIRGCDLLEPTARQLSFYHILERPNPQYGHVPLAVTNEGYKLSKQNKAPAIDNHHPQPALVAALTFLGQEPPAELISASVEEIIAWSIGHWSLDKVPRKQQITLPE
ncbi:tRNA glutamyl-Q(34) synthetase GluQRS [Thalassomonas actiniarum]|uniref:Glutamyl-Q tRNA(Asp) synthetase n=1 Tax=Thalassomonas actiniarum TaxID=485447 RepID=A0AAF0C2V1_9GAMM|nr:tRNA glutamyl-Q(34) synthetase GluQRS [Thalassomonas actiniarum]WDD98230.1 tRNA glutamyl-Q(34) synthetase GluQRS [Thalassomonas actiniarum]